jgi:hypothetical protein
MSTAQKQSNDNAIAQHQLSDLLKSVQSKIIGQQGLIEAILVCLLDGFIGAFALGD